MHIEKTGRIKEGNWLRRFWEFLKEDTWQSMVVSLILAFIIIKFIFFPVLSFITGASMPLVIVESCSMHHSRSLAEILNDGIYDQFGIGSENTSSFSFKNGLEKGDIIIVVSAKEAKVGNVIIFQGGQKNPIIHRIVRIDENDLITTKGDNNNGLLPAEQGIKRENVIGKAVFRVPYLGWLKLIFYEPFRSASSRGFCH